MAPDARSSDARFCPACGSALAPTEAGSTRAGQEAMDPAHSGFIGREVAGRYRILAKLGEGGMGAVYRAEQMSLKRIVALKVLRPELSAEAGMVRRFNAEAELAARLSHPNTVVLFDFGQDADGALFIAMEYLEGHSLRELLSHEGPLAPGRALAICEQVCASLADAHGHGIVHRDLKPDNVMLIQRGRQADVVRVLDFGIAKLRDEQGGVTARPLTQAGDMLGTPQYMAPEQIRGEKVDARTDVYALGAMLYEMVTGRLPFEGPSLMAILSKHLTEMPLPPRERRPDLRIAPGLSQLVMDGLQKDPSRRPPSMDVFADRLARLVVEMEPRGARGYPPPPALTENPPPGVPRTPAPGSLVTPFDVPAMGAHASPTPAAPGPYPSPPPYGSSVPYPPPPPVLYPVSPHVSPPQGVAYPPPHPHGPSPGRARGLAVGLVGALAAGGAVAVFLVARDGDERQDAVESVPARTERAVVADFSVQPERKLYVDDSPASAEPTGEPWNGGWWVDSSGVLEIDLPAGFSVGSAGSEVHFAGSCGGTRCTIQVITAPTYGVEVDDGMIGQLVSQMPQEMGQVGTIARVRVQGADRPSVIIDNPAEGLRGQLVVFSGPGTLALVMVQMPGAGFDAAAGFREEFFERRVRMRAGSADRR